MKKEEKPAQDTKKRSGSLTFSLLSVLFAIVVALGLFLQMSVFQSYLVQEFLKVLSNQAGHRITVGSVEVRWLDDMLINDFEVRDLNDNIMIKVPKAYIDFDVAALFSKKSGLKLDAARLTDVQVNLIKYSDSTSLNINTFIDSLKQNQQRKSPSAPFSLAVGRIKLDNATFTFQDMRKDSIVDRFDYYHFAIDSISGNISQFLLSGGEVGLVIDNLVAMDRAKYLKVRELQGIYQINNEAMSLHQMRLVTDHSTINESITLKYAQLTNLAYFNDSVNLDINFKQARIGTKDIGAFAPQYAGKDDSFIVNGKVSGKVSRLLSDSISVQVGRGSHITGKVYISGLPDVSEAFMDVNVWDGYLVPEDFRPYIKQSYDLVKGVGPVKLKGEFMGFVSDFVANGTFTTSTGFVRTDINLKIPDQFENTEYKGKLVLSNFDLGGLFGNRAVFQQINMTGNISGSGITLQNADFLMNAQIASVGINSYQYKNIDTDGRFASQFFEGNLTIDDPNLQVSGFANANFRENQERILAELKIDTIAFQPTNIYSKPLGAIFEIDIDVENFQIDSLIGYAYVNNLLMSVEDEYLAIRQIEVSSSRKNRYRNVRLRSDLMDATIEGEFLFTEVGIDLPQLYEEYRLGLRNNAEMIDQYYQQKVKGRNNPYNIDLQVLMKDINPLAKLFMPQLQVSNNTTLTGEFKHGTSSIFTLYATPDSITYMGNRFYRNELELTMSKTNDSTDVLGMALLASKSQKWANITKTKEALVEAVWNGPKVDFKMDIEQVGIGNFAHVVGQVDFLVDTSMLSFKPSLLTAFDKKWQFDERNRVIFLNGEVLVENLKLAADDEYLLMEGVLSEDESKTSEISIFNFNLVNIQPFISMDYSGRVDGKITLNDAFNSRSIQSDIRVGGFHIDRFLVGDLRTISKWENNAKRFRLGLDVHRDRKKVIDIVGYFTPGDSTEQLSLVAELDDARLNIAEPFLKTLFTDLNGDVDGLFVVGGTIERPILKGRGLVSNGTMLVNYLNTRYNFTGEISFEEDHIGFREMIVRDIDGNRGTVNGGIYHTWFRDFSLDFTADVSNLQVLNTSAKDNSLYYGTAYGTGTINMEGTFANLSISATATTAKGTRLFIPLSDQAVVEQEEYISFVNFAIADTLKRQQISQKVNLSGIKLDFDLDITTDAYCEIIFDIKSGDIIRGRGTGNLKLQIDTKGDFNMFGDFEIATGAYNFTLYNIINKEFNILPGSRISWYGDPYEGILSIKANYRQLTALTPIMTTLDEDTRNSPELRRKYPAMVQLKLDGAMLAPDIGFGIEFSDYPDNILLPNGTLIALGALLSSFKARIAADEQELKRQVFSLIILRRLSPENSFTVAGGQTIGSSVSEFVSNQLSYWITQVDENLEIDVDLNSLDSDALNTFQLRLSYTFFDGRLRISRGGGFTNTATNHSDFNTILGDWSLEYLLTPDGKLRAKMFNRIDQNNFMTLNNTMTETGFSIQYVRSFDQLAGILRDERKKRNAVEPTSTDPPEATQESKEIDSGRG